MIDGYSALEVLRLAVGALLIAGGLGLVAGGAVGLLRFPDLYIRLHAVNVADAIGAAIVLGGLAVIAADASIALRLLLLAVLLAAVAPVLSHFLAGAAHAGGLDPIVGRYAAPRPGAKPHRDDAP